jgi:hypothetical protein
MTSFKKPLLFALLVVLLLSQTTDLPNLSYDLQGQTFSFIYGNGSYTGANSERPTTSTSTNQPDTTYTPPAQSPPPVAINCPINQVYDNTLCQCVCVKGFYFQNNTCVAYNSSGPTCGKNQLYQSYRCVCAVGYFLIGSDCDVCPPYTTYNLATTSCVCAKGYVLVEGECRLPYT